MNPFEQSRISMTATCLPCCISCEPSCAVECETDGVFWYCDPGHVPPFYSEAPVQPFCQSVWYPEEEIDCDGTPETVPQGVVTFSVRAILSCLVIGQEYMVTLTFSGTDQLWCCEGDCPADEYPCPEPWTSTTEITFTATATTETTDWVAAPVADGSPYNELNEVNFDGCELEAL
jgi:hypothetical protein